ncbi:MAG TPA: protein kinase, partial [Kofleriaceae bacterium]|nr:protein kinase [Kofleriaceae bacterium]
MAHTPSGPPGGRKSASQGPPIGEDYGDFEGDPTSINQIPQGPPGPTPRAGGMTPPQHFSQGSPQLSHMGQPPNALPNSFNVQTTMSGPPGMMQQPGPPMAQVSGVIAQPTPYVSRSRIYAFVVDETGMPIELGSGRFAKAYLGEERWVESKTTLRRPVAIKCLQKGVTGEDQMRFQMEKEILERVQGHPNIVELLASGEGDSTGFIPPSVRDKVENDFMILE